MAAQNLAQKTQETVATVSELLRGVMNVAVSGNSPEGLKVLQAYADRLAASHTERTPEGPSGTLGA